MLREAWSKELAVAQDAKRQHDGAEEWRHLQRAHVLSQPMAGPHVRTHVAMLGSAFRRRDGHEFAGQLFRLVVAAPGSWSGRYPVGNTGGSDVSAVGDADTRRPGSTARGRERATAERLRPQRRAPIEDSAGRTAVTDDFFPTDIEGLAEVKPSSTLRLFDGDHVDLRIAPVTKHLGDDVLRMLAYNESIPGPTLHVDQGSELTVDVHNDGDLEATVHWHGLRVENRYDGVPFETQAPIPIGGKYTQKVKFPDAGFYWYHPHIREDYGLELGLYGTVIVEPSDPSYWAPSTGT